MNELLVGVDWSQSHYDVTILAPNGARLTQFRISKTPAGFTQLAEKIDKFGLPANCCHIGLETAHNVLVDYLWGQGYSQVYVIPPSVVKSSRGRYGNSQVRTDERDARLLADLLRTDLARLQPWRPDSLLTPSAMASATAVPGTTDRATK